jgi:hypothetical protein
MERSWKWRRLAIFSTLIVCDLGLLYLILWGEDTALNRDIGNGMLLLIAAIVNGYIFGAAWDDKIKGGERLGRPPQDGGEGHQ